MAGMFKHKSKDTLTGYLLSDPYYKPLLWFVIYTCIYIYTYTPLFTWLNTTPQIVAALD